MERGKGDVVNGTKGGMGEKEWEGRKGENKPRIRRINKKRRVKEFNTDTKKKKCAKRVVTNERGSCLAEKYWVCKNKDRKKRKGGRQTNKQSLLQKRVGSFV